MHAKTRSIKTRALMAASVLAVSQAACFAGATFSSGTATWTFDPDTAGGSQLKTLTVKPPPASSAMPVSPNFQLNQTFTNSSASAVAKGSIGYVVNPTTTTFTLAAGTGVAQADPSNLYPGDSDLRVDFDGIFLPTAPGFGPPATGYVSIAVGGIVGAGGHSRFTGQVQFLNGNTSSPLRSTVNFDQAFNTPGSFAQTFTSSALLNPSIIPVGTPIRVKGFFDFRAANELSPSSMLPLDIEFGAAPPTATFYGGGGSNWSNPTNWTAPIGSIIDDPGQSLPTIPNGAGQRARFINAFGGSPSLTLDQNITLGAIDFDTANGANILANPTSGFSLRMETQPNPQNPTASPSDASIFVRSNHGNNTQHIGAPIVMANSMGIFADGTYQGPGEARTTAMLSLDRAITGVGNSGLSKHGRGFAALNSANSFTGGTVIDGGRLDANIAGALGTGSVLASNGRLDYNAVHAAAPGALVLADNGGQIDLGVAPEADDQFTIGATGVISGNASELSTLNAAVSGGNLHLTGGSMIAHESFDATLASGNPQGIAATTPQYIFGIAADFNSDVGAQKVITIGSLSGTPWRGFGSDRSDRSFGTLPHNTHEIININGDGELRALDETLSLYAQVNTITGGSTVTKTGQGAVALNNDANTIRAPITVQEGLLLINGSATGVTQLEVKPGASLGGVGRTDGPVNIEDQATIAPGNNTFSGRVGTLAVGGLKLAPTSLLNFDLGEPGLIGAGNNDLIEVNGDLMLDGILDIADVGNFGIGEYNLMQFSGQLTDQGLDFGNVPDGLSYSIRIDSVPGGLVPAGGEVVLVVSAVPEPAALAMLALGALPILGRRRRQHR